MCLNKPKQATFLLFLQGAKTFCTTTGKFYIVYHLVSVILFLAGSLFVTNLSTVSVMVDILA